MDGTRLRTGRRTVKGVTGYDVTALLVGSEGTLGVFTRGRRSASCRSPPTVATLLALFADVRRARPRGAAHRRARARAALPRASRRGDARRRPRARRRPSTPARGAMLLIEVDGDARALRREAERVGERCTRAPARSTCSSRRTPAQRERLWERAARALARHARAGALQDLGGRRGAALAHRRSPRRGRAHLARRTGVRMLTYGHAGDGNLHVNFLWNDPDERPAVERAIEQLFRDVVAHARHALGRARHRRLKAPYLPLEQSAELIDAAAAREGGVRSEGPPEPGQDLPGSDLEAARQLLKRRRCGLAL